jgi:hypothetical protein
MGNRTPDFSKQGVQLLVNCLNVLEEPFWYITLPPNVRIGLPTDNDYLLQPYEPVHACIGIALLCFKSYIYPTTYTILIYVHKSFVPLSM